MPSRAKAAAGRLTGSRKTQIFSANSRHMARSAGIGGGSGWTLTEKWRTAWWSRRGPCTCQTGRRRRSWTRRSSNSTRRQTTARRLSINGLIESDVFKETKRQRKRTKKHKFGTNRVSKFRCSNFRVSEPVNGDSVYPEQWQADAASSTPRKSSRRGTVAAWAPEPSSRTQSTRLQSETLTNTCGENRRVKMDFWFRNLKRTQKSGKQNRNFFADRLENRNSVTPLMHIFPLQIPFTKRRRVMGFSPEKRSPPTPRPSRPDVSGSLKLRSELRPTTTPWRAPSAPRSSQSRRPQPCRKSAKRCPATRRTTAGRWPRIRKVKIKESKS